MSKKKKTRQQKIQADKRRQNMSIINTHQLRNDNSTILSSSPSFPLSPISSETLQKNIVDYTFVRHDLVRTILVTSAIILAEFLLFYFLK